MIRKRIIKITQETDFDVLLACEELTDYINVKIVDMLKNHMKDKVDKIIVETPYYDSDYLSTYYSFYIKKFRKYDKENVRIHFYFDDKYYGYMTFRPTMENTTIGKTYLEPRLFLSEGCHVITNQFKVHLFGVEQYVDAFPWMQQETDVAVCAHVAIWSILRYFGTKYSSYNNINMGNVVDKLPENIERKIPTSKVSIQKIPDIFKQMGFSPIVVSKALVGENIFQREMIAYLDSGIPMVGCMTEKKHAVAIIGYELENKDNVKKIVDNTEKMVYNGTVVNKLIVNDDNYHPYLALRKKSDFNPFDDSETIIKKERFIEDIDYLVIPLYDRMQYNYSSVRHSVEEYLKDSEFLDAGKKYIVKTYITSANSLKEHASCSIDNAMLRDTFIRMAMPRFVWCVDFCTYDEYVNKKISARILIDTTCTNNESDPWLLVHNDKYVKYYDSKVWHEERFEIEAYNKFENLGVINNETDD